MELIFYGSNYHHHEFPILQLLHPTGTTFRLSPAKNHSRRRLFTAASLRADADTKTMALELQQAAGSSSGGKMVVELIGAFNQLTERMSFAAEQAPSTSSSSILFQTLKLSIPLLHALPLAADGRSPLSKALSVAVILADLQVRQMLHYPLVRIGR